MKTRIIKIESNSGKEKKESFFIERRILFFFWVSLRFPFLSNYQRIINFQWSIPTFSSKDQAERFLDIFILNPKTEIYRGMKIVRVINPADWELPTFVDINDYSYRHNRWIDFKNVGVRDTREMKERYDKWNPIKTKEVLS